MMLETVEVIIPPLNEPVLGTPGEAIAYAETINRVRRHPEMDSCVGQRIRSAGWSDDAISLHLENEKILRFGYTESGVNLTIMGNAPKSDAGRQEPQKIRLIFPTGQETLWERGKLIRTLEGNALRGVQVTQSCFFLYVTNVDVLLIDFLIDRSTGRPFLYWGWTD